MRVLLKTSSMIAKDCPHDHRLHAHPGRLGLLEDVPVALSRFVSASSGISELAALVIMEALELCRGRARRRCRPSSWSRRVREHLLGAALGNDCHLLYMVLHCTQGCRHVFVQHLRGRSSGGTVGPDLPPRPAALATTGSCSAKGPGCDGCCHLCLDIPKKQS